MKLKDLNRVIFEGDYLLYNQNKDESIVYDNTTKEEYKDYTVKEIYPFEDVMPTVVIEISKEDIQ